MTQKILYPFSDQLEGLVVPQMVPVDPFKRSGCYHFPFRRHESKLPKVFPNKILEAVEEDEWLTPPKCSESIHRNFQPSPESQIIFPSPVSSFLLLNSVALHGDGCPICQAVETELIRLSGEMNCSLQVRRRLACGSPGGRRPPPGGEVGGW